MTTEPRYLALVAKVDERLKHFDDVKSRSYNSPAMKAVLLLDAPFLNALKVAIMAHEEQSCQQWIAGNWVVIPLSGICKCGDKFPCPEFLDIEVEVGK